MANCPMCGEVWNEATCATCGWFEGKPTRYTEHRDKRKTGEGAIKGWATRRKREAERKAASEVLIDVMDEIGGLCVHGVRVTDHPGKFLVGAVTLVGWRDRVSEAVRRLKEEGVTNDGVLRLNREDS